MRMTAKPKYDWTFTFNQDEAQSLNELAKYLLGKGNFQPCLLTEKIAKEIVEYTDSVPDDAISKG